MMGKAMINTVAFTRKTDSGFLFLTEKETSLTSSSNCINCGVCAQNCPMRLMPNALSVFSVAGDTGKLAEYHIMDCMECGSCTYICPQRRFIVQHIKAGKTLLRAKNNK
jgi:electron transport complex protein RnfC